MGLLDSLLGSVSGGATPGQSSLAVVALQLIEQHGGLPGIISKFQQGGMAAQAGSWVGTGANMPITGSQLQEVLGTGSIGQIAQQLGLSHGEASAGLAQMLPQLINHLTPNGQVPGDHSALLQQALSLLSKPS
jgi:uncharacterized protein YidB (DUF937 family)